MSTVIQTYPFLFNKDEDIPALRFPNIALRAYSFNIQIADTFYTIIITYNTWANSPQVSIYDQNQNAISLNAPLIENLVGDTPNYLFGKNIFYGYSLVWDINSQVFIFSED